MKHPAQQASSLYMPIPRLEYGRCWAPVRQKQTIRLESTAHPRYFQEPLPSQPMTTAPIQSLECVPLAVREKPKYVGDHVIRHYRQLGLAALLRDIGADQVDHMTIEGGIGTLTMYADGREDWRPTLPSRPAPDPPRPADPALAEARRSSCRACGSFRDFRCTAAGCGCAGEGRPEVWSSRCPLGRWPMCNHHCT